MIHSAGILLYRLTPAGVPEVLIAHMGGPYWAAKDAGAWSIPKGVLRQAQQPGEEDEPALDAARREFREELGIDPPDPPYGELGTFAYSSGKRVTVFVADGTGFALDGLEFGEFELEWPPRSGRTQSFPEVDRVEWTTTDAARERLVKGQRAAIDRLEELLAVLARSRGVPREDSLRSSAASPHAVPARSRGVPREDSLRSSAASPHPQAS